AASCLSKANAIARESVSNGYAWFVGALMASRLGQDGAMQARLIRSYKAMPNDQWLAALRVNLVEDRLDEVGASLLAEHERALKLLVRSQRGIDSSARRWIGDEDFRERILALVETLPERDQERFVGRVAALARARR